MPVDHLQPPSQLPSTTDYLPPSEQWKLLGLTSDGEDDEHPPYPKIRSALHWGTIAGGLTLAGLLLACTAWAVRYAAALEDNGSRASRRAEQHRDLETAESKENVKLPLQEKVWTSEGATPWVLGLPKESCQEACEKAGLVCQMDKERWPRSRKDLSGIARKLGQFCENFTSAEQTFDPSVSGAFCSYGPWKPLNMWKPFRPTSVRSCKAAPPAATRRFCPCARHKKKRTDCKSCDPSCYKTKDCCPKHEDPCAPDPLQGGDPKWWGSGLSRQAPGVDPDAWCQRDLPEAWRMPKMWPYTGGEVVADAPPAHVKVLSYNLFWWNLFKARKGNKKSAGKLISASGSAVAFDVMGFQECEDPKLVLADAALLPYYHFFLGPHSTCVAFRNGTWELLDRGAREVAEDGKWVKNQYYGRRSGQWLRLRHRTSGRILFFLNHHGPLPLNSGGACGGVASAYNLLKIVGDNAQKGDAVIIVGDFNAVANSTTVINMQTELHKLYVGSKFGGVDNMFANVDAQRVVEKSNYGGGGSDHDALGLVLELRSEGAFLAPHGLVVGAVMS